MPVGSLFPNTNLTNTDLNITTGRVVGGGKEEKANGGVEAVMYLIVVFL